MHARAAAEARHMQQQPHSCIVCDAAFSSSTPWARFCGVKCRREADRIRQAARAEAKRVAPEPRDCIQCGKAYIHSHPQVVTCSRECRSERNKGLVQSNARTCEHPHCGNPHLAKGLCHSHYRKTYPNRYTYETHACVVCGEQTTRRNGGPKRAAKYLPTCSNRCRNIVGHGLRTDLPGDHPARWYGQHMAVAFTSCKFCRNLFAHNGRQARTYCQLHGPDSKPRFVSTSCHDCGKPVMLDRQAYQSTAGYGHAYCGKTCSRRASRRRRRAREFNAAGEFRWVDMIGLWLALGKRCAYCGIQSDKQPDPDHVVALSRGGDNTIDNILPACRRCNSDKRTLTIAEWTTDRRERGKPTLPHPWRAMGWRRIEQAPGEGSSEAA